MIAVLAVLGITCARANPEGQTATDRSRPPTLQEMHDNIKSMGAALVIRDLFSKHDEWNGVLERISSGDTDWLKMAVVLRKDSDGGASEELDIVAAEALQKAPASVLGLLAETFTIETLCGNENSLRATLTESLKIISERRAAVAKVRDQKLEPQKQRCIALLDQLEKECKNNADTWFTE